MAKNAVKTGELQKRPAVEALIETLDIIGRE